MEQEARDNTLGYSSNRQIRKDMRIYDRTPRIISYTLVSRLFGVLLEIQHHFDQLVDTLNH